MPDDTRLCARPTTDDAYDPDDEVLRRILRSGRARLIGRGLPADHPDLPAHLDALDARLDRQEPTP